MQYRDSYYFTCWTMNIYTAVSKHVTVCTTVTISISCLAASSRRAAGSGVTDTCTGSRYYIEGVAYDTNQPMLMLTWNRHAAHVDFGYRLFLAQLQ